MYQSLAKNFVMHASHNDIFIFHLNHSKAYVGLCNKLGCYFVQHFVIQLALFKSVSVCVSLALYGVYICVCDILKTKVQSKFYGRTLCVGIVVHNMLQSIACSST